MDKLMQDDGGKVKHSFHSSTCSKESEAFLNEVAENPSHGSDSKICKNVDKRYSRCCSVSFKTLRYVMAIGQSGGFLSMGLILTAFGLALPTLAENLKLSINETSPALISRGAGFLFGSITCGLLESFLSAYILYIGFMIISSVGMLFTPVMNVVSLYVCVGVAAIGMGGAETIGNVLTLHLWGTEAEPAIQFLHFWYCIGSAICPLLMEPFINEAIERNKTSYVNGTSNGTVFREPLLIENSGLPLVSVPFIIVFSIVMIFVAFILITIPCSFINKSSSQQENTVDEEGNRFRIGMLVLLFVFYFIYVGIEVSFITFLYTFGLSDMPGMALDKPSSAHLSSVYLFSVVIGQFFAIFMSRRFSPTVIISVDLFGMTTASLIMLMLPFYGNIVPHIFWIAVGLFGFFCASIYGTTFLWAERYITVNAKAACVFIVGASVGEMILPIPIGLYIDRMPMLYLYANMAYMSFLTLLFIIMWKFASSKGERVKRDVTNSEKNVE